MTQRRPYTPRDFQPIGTQFMLDNPRCALWAGMGMGKSLMTLTMIDTRYLAGWLTRPTLILGPLRVARDVWTDEAAKWDHLSDLRISAVVGDEKQRERALKRDVQIYTTNYEQLPWLVAKYGKSWPFQLVVADECTKLKGFRLNQGGKRAQALSKVAFLSPYWVNLSGTPAPNGLKDLWGQTWFLDRGKRLGLTYSGFMERWFVKGYDGFSYKPLKFAEDHIHTALKDICLTLDPKDWFDLEEPVVTQIKVKLPAPAMKLYKELEDDMYTELTCGTEVEVFNAAALTNKCLQLANGFLYNEGAVKHVHEAKLEALESITEEVSEPLLVAYNFVEDVKMIKRVFPKAVELSTDAGMKAFKAGDVQIGLGHPQSMGHGVDGLQDVCHHLVRYGHTWNLEHTDQMRGRIGPVRQKQSGFTRAVQEYDLVAEGTIDETVIASRTAKTSVQECLLNAMKVRL